MPTSTLSTMGAIGEKVNLHTQMVLREDSVALYGFNTPEELELFQIVTGVSGVGPKLGLAILSSMSVERMSMAIASSDTDLLTTIPGIGKKMAARLILELKDKIGVDLMTTGIQPAPENGEVIGALISLGYSVAEASRAVTALSSSDDLSLEEKVRLALQYFAIK